MSKSTVIAILGVLGWVLSYALFFRWLAGHGWDFFGGWVDAFTASDFATGLLVDLVFSTWMITAVAWWERRRLGTAWAVAMVACLALSVSMCLAVYLVRCWQLQREAASGADGV